MTLYKKLKIKSPTTAKITKNIAIGSAITISAGVGGIAGGFIGPATILGLGSITLCYATSSISFGIATTIVSVGTGAGGITGSIISGVTTSKFLNKCKNKNKLGDNNGQNTNQKLDIEEINKIDAQNVEIITTKNKLSIPQM